MNEESALNDRQMSLIKNSISKNELEFLRKHKLPLECLFNAKYLTATEYKVAMKTRGKLIAFNVTPCKKKGHKLRTRHGACILCNPSVISRIKKNQAPGIIYIAGSLKFKIFKVGFSVKDGQWREDSLNRTAYANCTDWKVLYAIQSEDAGILEDKVQTQLRKFQVKINYRHAGKKKIV